MANKQVRVGKSGKGVACKYCWQVAFLGSFLLLVLLFMLFHLDKMVL